MSSTVFNAGTVQSPRLASDLSAEPEARYSLPPMASISWPAPPIRDSPGLIADLLESLSRIGALEQNTFWNPLSIQELAQQHAVGFERTIQIGTDPWESDEEMEEFLQNVYLDREESSGD
jgi:hypothetical protein